MTEKKQKHRIGMGSASLLVAAIVLLVSGAKGDISGSAHDFSSEAWSGYEICVVCHTPHNAQAAVAPLWDHEITTEVFTPYDSPTMDVWKPGNPGGVSRLCLSCHDGITSVDAYGGRAGSVLITGDANLNDAASLTNDHPISFPWKHQTSQPCSNMCHDFSGGEPVLPVFDHMIECATCHDVHNGSNVPKLLRISNDGSALCLTCHTSLL